MGDDRRLGKVSVTRDRQREERDGTGVEGRVSRGDFHKQGRHPGSKGSCYKEGA